MTYLTVKEMPQEERPRERLARVGPQALSSAELLAIILRTGVGGENVLAMAQRLLANFDGLAGMARLELAQLTAEHGLGPAKAAQLLAAFELGRRLMAEAPEERYQIRYRQSITRYRPMPPLYEYGFVHPQPLQYPECAIAQRFDVVPPNYYRQKLASYG